MYDSLLFVYYVFTVNSVDFNATAQSASNAIAWNGKFICIAMLYISPFEINGFFGACTYYFYLI